MNRTVTSLTGSPEPPTWSAHPTAVFGITGHPSNDVTLHSHNGREVVVFACDDKLPTSFRIGNFCVEKSTIVGAEAVRVLLFAEKPAGFAQLRTKFFVDFRTWAARNCAQKSFQLLSS